mgnify:CR=1 FL=1
MPRSPVKSLIKIAGFGDRLRSFGQGMSGNFGVDASGNAFKSPQNMSQTAGHSFSQGLAKSIVPGLMIGAGVIAKGIGSATAKHKFEQMRAKILASNPSWDPAEVTKYLHILLETKPELFSEDKYYSVETMVKQMVSFGGASSQLIQQIAKTPYLSYDILGKAAKGLK